MNKETNKFYRVFFLLAIFAMMIAVAPSMTRAATTQSVTISATPTFIAIVNAPSSVYALTSSIITSTTETAPLAASATPATSAGFFTITNTSTVPITISIWAVNFTGGSVWTLSDSAVPGSDIAGMYAGIVSGTFNTVIKTSPGNTLKASLASTTNQTWHLKLMTPTVFGDGAKKTSTVTLSAAAS